MSNIKAFKSKDGNQFKTETERDIYEKLMNKYYKEYKNGEIMTFDFGVKDKYFYVVFADEIESERCHEDNLSIPYALDLIVSNAVYAHKEKTDFKYKRYMTENELNKIKKYGEFYEGDER